MCDEIYFLFSNPDTTEGRCDITVKASLDGGRDMAVQPVARRGGQLGIFLPVDD